MNSNNWDYGGNRKDEIIIYCSIVSKSGIEYTVNGEKVQAWRYSDGLPGYHKN